MEQAVQRKHWTGHLALLSVYSSIICWMVNGFSITLFCSGALYPSWEIGIGFIPLVLGLVAIVLMPDRSLTEGAITIALIGVIISGLYLADHISNNIRCSRLNLRPDVACACLSNLKQLELATIMYAGDNVDLFPPPDKWNKDISKYIKNRKVFLCPVEKDSDLPCYAMNGWLIGLRMEDVFDPANTVMLFESEQGKNLYGGTKLFPEKPRHESDNTGYYTVGFVDGRVTMIPKDEIGKLNWNPKKK